MISNQWLRLFIAYNCKLLLLKKSNSSQTCNVGRNYGLEGEDDKKLEEK